MYRSLFAATALIASLASPVVSAAILHPVSVTGSGTFNNSTGSIHDDVFPPQGTVWTDPSNVWWLGSGASFVFDYGAPVHITDLKLSFDNNDTYTLETSQDGSSWANLATIDLTFGDVGDGMDTFYLFTSSDPLGNGGIPSPEQNFASLAGFSGATARYLRVQAIFGDDLNSIGEVQAISAVPLPGAAWLLLSGVGFLATRARRKAPT